MGELSPGDNYWAIGFWFWLTSLLVNSISNLRKHPFVRKIKAVGRYICGKPLCLYYDGEYCEDDADIEPCFPIRKEITVVGISIRALPGGRCLAGKQVFWNDRLSDETRKTKPGHIAVLDDDN